MSQVKDSEGNVLNSQHALRSRYTDDSLTTQDWFTLHPEVKPLIREITESEVLKNSLAANGLAIDYEAVNAALAAPTAADLDSVVAEQKVADETSGSYTHVSSVQLPSGRFLDGLAEESAVSGSTSPSDSPTVDVVDSTPSGN